MYKKPKKILRDLLTYALIGVMTAIVVVTLPEDHIVGKVSHVWKSKNPHTGKYRFDRFFKRVE